MNVRWISDTVKRTMMAHEIDHLALSRFLQQWRGH